VVNKRVFYAIQQLAIKDNRGAGTNEVAPWNSKSFPPGVMSSGVEEVWKKWEVPRGIQSVGMSTTFNLEQMFELGQVEIYEQSERQPDVEMTINKVLDGTKPLWFMVVEPSGSNNNLIGKTANFRCDAILNIYSDANFRATGNPVSACVGSGMYISSITYTFPVDGACTEEITLVGNDKIWASFDSGILNQDESALTPPITGEGYWEAPEGIPSGVFGWDNIGGAQETAGGSSSAGVLVVGSGIQRREKVDLRRSVLPTDIPGVSDFSSSGLYAGYIGGELYHYTGNVNQTVGDCNCDNIAEHIQNITLTCTLGREDLFELGSKRPFYKYVTYPVEVTASIEVITSEGDLIDARSLDNADNTVANNTIIIRTIDGLQVDLGDSNRLVSVDVGDGDTGGGNMTVTYNYQSFNTFNVSHDAFNPNHRIVIFETGNSRFNQGFTSFKRSDFGVEG